MSSSDRRAFLKHGLGTAAAIALAPELGRLRSAPLLSEPLGVALVGAGRQGRAILSELAKIEGVRVLAVCDTIDSRLQSGLRRAQGAEGFPDHRALLDKRKDVQAVLVATPTHAHREAAVDSLAAGKHVYCEGPLASTLEDCRAIVRAARSAKTVFQTGMQARSNPIYQLARSFARSGVLRDVVALRAQHHRKTSWRAPASSPAEEKALNWQLDPSVSLGLAGELGVHQLDVFHWFLGAYPTSVRGSASLQLHKDGREMPDTELLELAFPGDRRLVWDGTLASSFEGAYEQLHGSMGTIRLAWTAGWLFKEADAPTQGWEVYANRERFHDEQGITLIADATKLAAQNKLKEGVGLPNPPLTYALEDFVRSIAEKKPAVCSAGEGLRAAAVAILARQAIRTGEKVAIDESALKEE